MHSSMRANVQFAKVGGHAYIARLVIAAIAVATSLSNGCCSTGYLTLRTLVTEPSKYCFKIDKVRSLSVYHRWAEEEWERVVQNSPDAPNSVSYHAGFVDGFVDYVYHGGTGEPPPIPPREFWNIEGRSPDGKAMANDWFAGFRHGSRMGAEGGYRVLATLHTSFGDRSDLPPGAPMDGPMNGRPMDAAMEALPAPATAAPAVPPTGSPLIPPQTSTDSIVPLEPNDLPLESAPATTEQMLPPGEVIPLMPNNGEGATAPAEPEVKNPFRTASAEPVIQTAAPDVETQSAPLSQPESEQNEDLTPPTLPLPSETQSPATLTSLETSEQTLVADEPVPAPLPAIFAALPAAANENWAMPRVKKQLTKAELLELTAVPIEQPKDVDALSAIDSQTEIRPIRSTDGTNRLTKAELMTLTALPLEQPAAFAASAQVQLSTEVTLRPEVRQIDPIREAHAPERTVRERNRAAYFAK
jgi:hypothetical protein